MVEYGYLSFDVVDRRWGDVLGQKLR